jgi:murein DD-endopeptidase MepM/ murein hydrolase activator NlpD
VGGFSQPGTYQFGGNATTITGDDGLTYYMAHGSIPFKGGRVEAGEPIGAVGNTGAPGVAFHLHYAIANDGNINRGYRGGSGNVWVESWMWGG